MTLKETVAAIDAYEQRTGRRWPTHLLLGVLAALVSWGTLVLTVMSLPERS